MNSVPSIKARLTNYAKKTGRTVQEVFTTYIIERVLYRLSISKYADNFTLKGGVLLYGLYMEDFFRSTTDIDLLGIGISNDKNDMKSVFEDILSLSADDPIRFNIDNLEVSDIAEFKQYHGVRISTMAYLDRTRVPVIIDVGFGDIVYPNRMRMDFPTLINDIAPSLYVYSIYSMIAEKTEAIISLGITNSRYKDFYDLFTIPEREDLDGRTLKNALTETFNNRNTSLDTISAFDDGFADNYYRQQRWKGFLKSKNVMLQISFSEVVASVKAFLFPVIESIRDNKEFSSSWNHSLKNWECEGE